MQNHNKTLHNKYFIYLLRRPQCLYCDQYCKAVEFNDLKLIEFITLPSCPACCWSCVLLVQVVLVAVPAVLGLASLRVHTVREAAAAGLLSREEVGLLSNIPPSSGSDHCSSSQLLIHPLPL